MATLPQEDPAAPDAQPLLSRPRGQALAAVLVSLLLANFLAGLDQIIVDTALPHIVTDLHGLDRYTWVVTAYLLASTAMIPIAGKLSDQFGRKWLLIGGIALFLVSSALAGASQTMDQLILFRGLQGLSAGSIQVLVSTIIADLFPGAERARWQGLTTGVYALASVVGPAAGGWLTDHPGWRWVFYVNVPLAPLALLALFFWLPANISARSVTARGWAALRRVDLWGALTATVGTVCLLLGLTWGGQTYPWGSAQVVGLLVVSGACFVAFIVIERFVAAEPILPLAMTRNQVFAAGALLSLTMNMALLALMVYISLFVQGVLGQSATSSGVIVTPLTVSVMLAAVVSGLLVRWSKRYQWVICSGAVIFTAGAFLMTRLTPDSSPITITRNMIVLGFGVGMALPVLTIAVQNAVPRAQLGAGTGAISYLRSLGSTLGVAVVGTIVTNTTASELARRLPASARQLPQTLLNAATNQQALLSPDARQAILTRVPPALRPLVEQIFAAARESLAVGITHAFAVALGLCGLVLVVCLFLKDLPLTRREPEPARQALIAEV